LRRELETRLLAQMTANYPGDVEINWQNVDLEKATEMVLVAPCMLEGKRMPSTVGRTHLRSIGIFQVDVLTPKDTGTGLRDEIAEFIGDFFAAVSYNLSDGGYAIMDEPEFKYMGMRNGRDRLVISISYQIDLKI